MPTRRDRGRVSAWSFDTSTHPGTVSSAVKTPKTHPLELYRWAVQDPDVHAPLLDLIHARVRGPHAAPARILREDFAGTAADSIAWLSRSAGRRAYAIDLDQSTLDWARSRAARLLGSDAEGLRCVRADVRCVPSDLVPPADILSVLNFSIMYLTTGPELIDYLRAARGGLGPGGVLVCNLFGGPANQRPGIVAHAVHPRPRSAREPAPDPFEYFWEIRGFDPLTAVADCRIHFRLPGPAGRPGRFLGDAVRYAFRLWTPDDMISACRAAGFSDARMWRHTHDPSAAAGGVYLGPADPASLAGRESWTAYVVATA